MNWQDICDNPLLKDLPFKFETDRLGQSGVLRPAWLDQSVPGDSGDRDRSAFAVERLGRNGREGHFRKKELYFARGAREFWVCREDGEMLFYNNHARLERNALVPDFPTHVELPV